MKRLPIGIQNINEIITGGYVYADKTEHIYNLISKAKYYFLSRPRRFGKSLLLDTISEVFKGAKELFKGLWIYDSGYDFEIHPVIRLDMSNIANGTPEILKNSLILELNRQARKESVDLEGGDPSDLLKQTIEALHAKYNQKIVVLIDEYDKPILDHLFEIETAEDNRQVLRSFYGVLKSMDPYLRFTFLTGVSKFAKTSVFSELNNLIDITLAEDYVNICGFAVEELGKHFSEHIEELKKLKRFQEFESIHDEILKWYDGYSWDGENKVINPFSLLTFFFQKRFGAYWYASGSPKFLIDLIKKDPGGYTDLKNMEMTEYMLDAADFSKLEATPLLFQTGYLTIKDIVYEGAPVYTLKIPNNEVREAFNKNIIAAFTDSGHTGAESAKMGLSKAFKNGDLQQVLDTLRGLFASIPSNLHIGNEAYYHSIFYAMMDVLGFDMEVEVSVSKGRVDAVIEFGDKAYVMEFKYKRCPPDASPEEKQKLFETALTDGMNQIKDRGYHKKYIGSGKTVYQVAFAFLGRDDIEMRIITE